MRCAAGQAWTGSECVGSPTMAGWSLAQDRCRAEGARLPTFSEVLGLFDECELLHPEYQRPWACKPCEESGECSALFATPVTTPGDTWTDTGFGDGVSVYFFNLMLGLVDNAVTVGAMSYLCVRES